MMFWIVWMIMTRFPSWQLQLVIWRWLFWLYRRIYTSRLLNLKSGFERSFRSQQNRIRYLEKKVAYQENLKNVLENDESLSGRQRQQKNPTKNSQQLPIHNESDVVEAFNLTGYYSLDIKEVQKESWRKEMAGRPQRKRKGSQQFMIRNLLY